MMKSKPFIWAHRGASGLAPENTMAAFYLAEQSGADGVELDVHLSRDGVPVVMHDDTVDRTTNGRGQISDYSLHSLQALDAGSWFSSEFSGEPVPMLADVLNWADNRVRLNIEIKTSSAGRAVLDLLAEYPDTNALVSSFRHDLLYAIRQWSSEIPIAFLTDSCFWRVALKRAVACRAASFHPPAQHVSRMMVEACHKHGLAVYPWTVDTLDRQRELIRIGVDGLFTNLPGWTTPLK